MARGAVDATTRMPGAGNAEGPDVAVGAFALL
jgi:hypothetical protein